MDASTVIEIYKAFKDEETSCLNLHRQYSQQYFTLIVAILAASLLAVYHFKDDPWITLVVLAAPVVNILLSITAIKMCNRFYQRFLEAITVQAKLEPLIGFNLTRPDESEASRPFPEDTCILPEIIIKRETKISEALTKVGFTQGREHREEKGYPTFACVSFASQASRQPIWAVSEQSTAQDPRSKVD